MLHVRYRGDRQHAGTFDMRLEGTRMDANIYWYLLRSRAPRRREGLGMRTTSSGKDHFRNNHASHNGLDLGKE
jgi:hypothetical protein